MLYMDGKLRHRPKTFMWSPRFKNVVFKSKLQQQRRSLNLSCSSDIVQCSGHISSSRSPNDLICFSWKDETIFRTFMSELVPILTLSMTFCSDKKIRIVTKSRCGHPLNNQSSNQQFQILAYKRRHLPCIQVFSLFKSTSCSLFLSLYFCNA